MRSTVAIRTLATLGAGRYGFESVSLGPHARLECTARCELRISGRLETGPDSHVGPALPGVGPEDVLFYVGGGGQAAACPRCEPMAASLGAASELEAFLFAPAGTIHLGAQALARGRLVGRHVWLGASSLLTGD